MRMNEFFHSRMVRKFEVSTSESYLNKLAFDIDHSFATNHGECALRFSSLFTNELRKGRACRGPPQLSLPVHCDSWQLS